jgi:hypothetical protein
VICAFLCSAPGSFAKVERPKEFCAFLAQSEVYVVLVQTNMYSGSAEQQDQSFAELLEVARSTLGGAVSAIPRQMSRFAKGMCVCVNSVPFRRRGPGGRIESYPPANMDLLIKGLCLGLKDERLVGWFFEEAGDWLRDNVSNFANSLAQFACWGGDIAASFLSSIGINIFD